MQRYKAYIVEIYSIPWPKIHFLDEASFVSRNLHSHKVYAPRGEKVFVFHGEPLAETLSVTLSTHLNKPKCLVGTMVSDTNSQYDFTSYLIYILSMDFVEHGDFIVLDNATIHSATDTFRMVYDLCEAKDVRIIFLPTYSPELNPVELCWAQIKRHIKESRRLQTSAANRNPLSLEIALGIAKITPVQLVNYYSKCIEHAIYNK